MSFDRALPQGHTEDGRQIPQPFWQRLSERGDAIAVVDSQANAIWTYRMLGDRVKQLSKGLRRRRRSLVLLFSQNDIDSVALYLAALDAGHVVLLSPAQTRDVSGNTLIERYSPEIVAAPSEEPLPILKDTYSGAEVSSNFCIFERRATPEPQPNEAMALMLSTSASSGSPKCARISAPSLAASALQVVQALRLSSSDRALLVLPISYVYGLSVLNSALCAGASVALVRGTPADRAYWEAVARSQATLIPAVSQTLEYMRWLGLEAGSFPAVRCLTHSGEALDPALLQWMQEHWGCKGTLLYLMYGQTEACGRISVLSPEFIARKPGSVGRAVPGGHITIGTQEEIVYGGPGVMLGYALTREDLPLGDTLHGVLNTGDAGRFDSDGFLYITGRLTRYCKIFGRRLSLDEVEAYIRRHFAAAVVEKGGVIVVFVEQSPSAGPPSPAELARRFGLPPQSFRVERLEVLPRTERGKIAYAALLARA